MRYLLNNMNTNILRKCVEELKQESPKIDYILGMLETVIELSTSSLIGTGTTTLPYNSFPIVSPVSVISKLNEKEERTGSYVETPGPIGKLE